jgi:hypothetical protein
MSSTLNSYGQIDGTIKYLRALATTTVYTPRTNISINTVLTSTLFTASTTSTTYPPGTIFRDMGKKAKAITTNGQDEALYILVQPQIGSTTEGVPVNYATQKFYVQVWASANSPVSVTVGRLG